MGLTQARAALITALEAGTYQHEPREAQEEKNLLAVGDVSPKEVIRLLNRCKGPQYSESPHHWAADVTVHLFEPEVGDETWYIKAYLLDEGGGTAVSLACIGHRYDYS
jgi:hypothetical protein